MLEPVSYTHLMRSADFVANIVSIYRRAIDSYVADPAGYHVNEEDWKNLFENRVRDYSTCFAMDKPDSLSLIHISVKI